MDEPYLPELRAACLRLPEVEELDQWGRTTFRVGGRMFALFTGSGVVVRTDPDERPALLADPRFWVPSSFGSAGWLGLDFTAAPVEWDEVAELVETSYRQVALKRMLRVLDPRT